MSEMGNAGRGGGDDRSRHQGQGRDDEGFGDEGSTLDGEPNSGSVTASDRGNTGAGAESAEGIHGSKGKQPEERSGVEHAHGEPGRGEGAGLSGSEPLRHREGEHKSGYGGEMGEPKTSSDQR